MSFSLAARPRKAGICEILQIFENRARTQATEPNTTELNGTTRWGGWIDELCIEMLNPEGDTLTRALWVKDTACGGPPVPAPLRADRGR